MFRVIKRLEFAASHKLSLPYESPCSRLHGHNYIVEVTVSGEELNEQDMLIDFSEIKRVVGMLDHQDLTTIVKGLNAGNATAEAIAFWIADEVQSMCNRDEHRTILVERVSVQESEGNTAIWER